MIGRILVGVGALAAVVVLSRRKSMRRESQPLSPLEAATRAEQAVAAAYHKAESTWLALSTEEVRVWRAWMSADAAEAKRLYAEERRLAAEVAAAKEEMERLGAELYRAGMARVMAANAVTHDLSCNIWHDAAPVAACSCR